MEGYVDYVIQLDHEITRELERDALGIEVPYMSEEYEEWMISIDRKTPNAAKTYIYYIKAADKNYFSFEDDFFALLPKMVKANDKEGVSALFDKYLAILDDELVISKKEGDERDSKDANDRRSAFRNYRRFIEEWLLPMMSGKLEKDIQCSTEEANAYKRLFAEDEFLDWLTNVDEKGIASAQSYLSRLKRLDRELCGMITLKQPGVHSVFGLIPRYFKEERSKDAVKLLFDIEEILKGQVRANNTQLMPIEALRNCISALRKYRQFFLSEYICDAFDIDESSNKDFAENTLMRSCDTVKSYDYSTLEDNFYFRIISQNRMSEGKDVFFPIGLIARICQVSEKVPTDVTMYKNAYKYFKKWVNDCSAEIRIATDKGYFILADLSEQNAMMIDTATKEVTVTLLDGRTARMLTETADGSSAPRIMKVDSLDQIHIDHSPQISNVLSEHLSELFTMEKLTAIIREVAVAHKLPIIRENFSAIFRHVIDSEKYSLELLKMLPLLFRELNLIRENSTLCLMEAKENLKKK